MSKLEEEIYKLIMNPEDHPKAYITTIGWSDDNDFYIWIKYKHAEYFTFKLDEILQKTREYVINKDSKKQYDVHLNLSYIIGKYVNLEHMFPKEKYSLRANIQNELFELITNSKNNHANYVSKFGWSDDNNIFIYVKCKHAKEFADRLLKMYGQQEPIDKDTKFSWSDNKDFYIWVKYKHVTKFMYKLREIFGQELFYNKTINGDLRHHTIRINLSELTKSHIDINGLFGLINTFILSEKESKEV